MRKIQLKTDGLTGENLAFVQQLNAKFAELPEIPDSAAIKSLIMGMVKGMFKENGDVAVNFEELAGLNEKVFGEGDDSISTILKKQGEIINAMKELQKDQEGSRVKSVRDQLKAFHEKNKDKLNAFLTGETKSFGAEKDKDGNMVAGIQLKAPGTITIPTHSNGSAFVPQVEVIPGLVDLVRNRPFIEQYTDTSSTNRARIVWTEKTNPEGEAAWLLEGEVKPLIDFEWISRESYAKKVAAKIKVSTESLQDVDWMAAEIEAELKYQVDIETDEALLAGTGDGTSATAEIKGLTQYVGGYVLTSIQTTTPNYFDVLRAARAQIVSLNFDPTHVFINPIDGANMDLTKDANGRPIMMEYRDNEGRLFRLQPIETNQIPVGSFLMGDMRRYKVRNYQPFSVYYGWVNDDFERNLVTVIGERRLHSYLATNHIGAFVYDQFADVQTAITAP